jgi:ligand-binding SRPBCC domain-containing protein
MSSSQLPFTLLERGQGVRISLTTIITAPVERVFDLARSITLHEKSMAHTSEKAVAGVTSGLIQLGETVTWQAKHLFKTRALTVQITAMQPYEFFSDEMVKGDFKTMRHHHYFKAADNGTIMTDEFTFTSPFGLLGKITNALFLTNYMKRLLQQRNNIIKEYAESNLTP